MAAAQDCIANHPEGQRPFFRDGLQWFVAKAPEGREAATALKCRRLIGPEVLADCFAPRVQHFRKLDGMWRRVEQPLYPGYLFMIASDSQALAKALKAATFPVALVGQRGNSYAPLAPAEQAWFAFVLDESRVLKASRGVIRNGAAIVQEGPLKGSEPRIRKIDRHKRTALVQLEMPDGDVFATVGLEITEKS